MWQLVGPAGSTIGDDNLYVRSGDGTTLNDWRTIMDSESVSDIETLSRQVWTDSGRGASTSGYWSKVCTVDPGTTQYSDRHMILAFVIKNTSQMSTCIISVMFRSNATSIDPSMEVEIISKNGSSTAVSDDSFKMISEGWGQPMVLWYKGSSTYATQKCYVLAEHHTGNNTITCMTAILPKRQHQTSP